MGIFMKVILKMIRRMVKEKYISIDGDRYEGEYKKNKKKGMENILVLKEIFMKEFGRIMK
jgi:hypothetical protein